MHFSYESEIALPTSPGAELQRRLDPDNPRLSNGENIMSILLRRLPRILFILRHTWKEAVSGVKVILVAAKLEFDAEYATDYSKLLELWAKVDGSTAGTSEHDEALREFQNHMDAFIKRIAADPDYKDLMQDLGDLNAIGHLKQLLSKLLELRAKVDSSPPGTSEHDEAVHELQTYVDAVIELNEPDYEGLLDLRDIECLKQLLGGPAYKGLVEEQATELVEQTSIEDAELMERLQLMREGNLAFPELEQLFQETLPIDVPSIVLPDLLPRYRTTDTSVAKLGSSFIEGYEDRIAEALVPETGTAPSTSSLVPGTADINIDADLPDVDWLPV